MPEAYGNLQGNPRFRKTVPISHFTCIGSTREDIKKQMEKCLLIGVNHILALRGDIPAGWEGTRGDFYMPAS